MGYMICRHPVWIRILGRHLLTCQYNHMTLATSHLLHWLVTKKFHSVWQFDLLIQLIVAANTAPVVRAKCVQPSILCQINNNTPVNNLLWYTVCVGTRKTTWKCTKNKPPTECGPVEQEISRLFKITYKLYSMLIYHTVYSAKHC